MGDDQRFDVVIIGAGLGGSAVAFALRDSGLTVLILERGGYLKQEPANWDPDEVIVRGRYDPDDQWLDGDGTPFTPRVYYTVGGSSKFFGGVALRFRPEDFQRRSYPEGDTVPWPIADEDLAPWYDDAERLMWVHGQAGRDPTEGPRAAYPNPPLEHEPQIAWLAGRLRSAGLHPVPLPMAIDQGPAGRCRKGSPCDGFPCKIRAKGDGENAFLRPALRQGGTWAPTVITGATVTRLTTDPGGRSVDTIHYTKDGSSYTATGRVVVLAAGAVNSAAVMLQSASPAAPEGLANSSGQVGRNVMTHNSTVLMAFSPFRRNPTRFQKTLAVNDYYAGDASDPSGPRGHIQMRGKVVEQNLRKSGRPLVRLFARFIARRSFDFWVMSEDLPLSGNRVEVLPGGPGPARVPTIRLTRTLSNLGPHRALVAAFRRQLRTAGLPIVLEREPSQRTVQHQCGTLRMGDDPEQSVVNRECRTHDLSNLYVADASVFPSSAAVNPALTVAANALRVGAAVREAMTAPARG